MAYTPYYSGGWQSGESGGTPITPAALNNMESGISANDTGVATLSGNTNPITDCNALTDTGIYKAINSTLNTPVANTHCVIYHALYTSGEMTQVALNTPDGAAYTRVYYGDTWSSWRKMIVATDVVDSLSSTATDMPLSAAKGKALNDAMPKTMSISATTDGTGRFVVAKPIDKLVAVHVFDNTCYTILRYLDTTQTLVYVLNINTNDPVANTSFTGNAVYFN